MVVFDGILTDRACSWESIGGRGAGGAVCQLGIMGIVRRHWQIREA